uniref:Facilitated trehalose transporter Tret1 n=1 Tax=Cacopsylla melanoneura TaxID=428564 RepID=A0A8D9ANP9_9HEMI
MMPTEKGSGTKAAKGGSIPKSESTSSTATTIEPSTPTTMEPTTSETQPLLAGSSSSSQDQPSKGDSLSRQIFLSIILIVPCIAPGMSFGYSAVALDQLPLTISQSSWFASLVFIAAPIGSLLSGPTLDKVGRKPALILTGVVGLIGWLLITYSLTITNLFIGRFLTGISQGLAATPSTIYIAESIVVHNTKLRGSLASWSVVAQTFGILQVYFMGSLLRYRKVAAMGAIISGLGVLLIAFIIPESPAWLNSKGRRGDAEWAARRLRLGPPTTQTEPTSRGDAEAGTSGQESMSTSNIFKEFMKPEAYKPLLILSLFFLFQQFSAVTVIITYMVDFIRSSGFHILNPYFITVIAGLIIFASTISISFILPTTGVKPLSAASGAGIAVSMFVIGIYLLFEKAPVINFEWGFFNLIPLAALILNIVASSVGFLPIPYVMLGEVFPMQIKGVAAGLATCLAYIFSFLAVKTYPYLHIMLGNGIFFFYGLVAALGTAHVLAYLPETKGKSLDEIMREFSS